MYAKVIKDSIYNGSRLITIEAEYPRYIHSQMMTYRMWARNCQSSRAVPLEATFKQLRDNPVNPIFMENKSGMTADNLLPVDVILKCSEVWDKAKSDAIIAATQLSYLGVHKQVVNRLLEPFTNIKTIITTNSFDNFFNQRLSEDSQQEITELAKLIKKGVDESIPIKLNKGEWHLPYITDYEISFIDPFVLAKVSAARVARVSYRKVSDHIDNDLKLFRRLAKDNHLSPLEQVCMASDVNSGCFKSFASLRSMHEEYSLLPHSI